MTATEEFLGWDERLDLILHPEVYCSPHWEEDGRGPDDRHASADDYTLEDLVDMLDYDEDFCPLHIDPRYPAAPSGVWHRDYAKAHERLASLTIGHARRRSHEHGRGDVLHEYHATAAELRQLWEDYPHARWLFEEQYGEGVIDLVVEEQ